MENAGDFRHIQQSTGAKKWISAVAVADDGDSQAIILRPERRYLNAIEVSRLRFWNLTGAGVNLGLAVRFPRAAWWVGTVTAAGAYTDTTAAAQNATADDLVLHNRANSGSGIVVSATDPFNILGILLSIAGDQTTPVVIVEYWNGSAWTNLAGTLIFADSLNATPGERILAWPTPANWQVGGSGTDVVATRYHVRVRQTHSGAGTVNPTASQLFVGFAMLFGSVEEVTFVQPIRFPQVGDALFPVFSVADAANLVEVVIRFT